MTDPQTEGRGVPRLAVRLVLVPLGFTLGATAGFATFLVGALLRASEHSLEALAEKALGVFSLFVLGGSDAADHFVTGLMAIVIVLAAAPLALVALVGEIARARSPLAYIIGAGLAYAALMVAMAGGLDVDPSKLALAGAASGACAGGVYWLVAGRGAGLT
jgi:hypothetical protein